MLIEIKELELHPVDFREEFSPGAIDLGEDVRQRTPLYAEGRADLVEEHHGKHEVVQDIRLKGKLETGLEVVCARCLEPVDLPVERSFDLLYRPLGTDAGRKELSVTAAEAEIGYYQGEGLAARRYAARAGVAGGPAEDDLPRGLQGTVPALRQESE